ncbi:MAG TPA: phosphatidylserine decarboxylase [Terriglobales bacterium]|nr:phosphatidylserine decarboxylase [Terriglobales bacterium]
MVRDGIYYALGMLVVAAFMWWLKVPLLIPIPILLAAFFLWFFRDPERIVPSGAGVIVSPADGKVTDVSAIEFQGKPYTRISIFLNVFDVHVNRSPVSGVIKELVYKPGKFANAMDPACVDANEQSIITVQGEGMVVVFKQIAGLLARRVVFNYKAGDQLQRGQRVGLIKFGSRTDVIFPSPAQIRVQVGDRVKGGSSVLAQAGVPTTPAAPDREQAGVAR